MHHPSPLGDWHDTNQVLATHSAAVFLSLQAFSNLAQQGEMCAESLNIGVLLQELEHEAR